jgi:hypothetical protein
MKRSEVDPQITQIDADLRAKNGPLISRIARSEENEENDPQITQIDADLRAKKGPLISRITRSEEKEKNDPQITQITRINGRKKAQEAQNEKLYRGRYVEPERISSDGANMSYKVIYCAASLK